MKELWHRAAFPAMGIAFFHFLLFTVASCGYLRDTTPTWHGAATRAFVVLGLDLSITLAGGCAYALLLRRRERMKLSGYALAGAVVGLLSNLLSRSLLGVQSFLVAALILRRPSPNEWMTWTLLTLGFFVNLLVFGIAGIVLGGIGGGLVGIFTAKRSNLETGDVGPG